MRVKSPKFRIQSVTVEDLTTSNTGNNPSLTMRFIAQVSVKNPNFGRYKYDQGSISFTYKGTQVGDAIVPQETARTKSTRKMIVTGAVTTVNSDLTSDISSGSVMLSTYSKISGKVYLMNMIDLGLLGLMLNILMTPNFAAPLGQEEPFVLVYDLICFEVVDKVKPDAGRCFERHWIHIH